MLGSRCWLPVFSAALVTTSASFPSLAAPPAQSESDDFSTLASLESGAPYVHVLGALTFGRGLRFNNPYRLSTQLGDSPESLSATASYVDVAFGAAIGNPLGLQYGLVTHLSVATDGISQEVLTPALFGLYRLSAAWQALARVGAPVVLEPDANLGAELAVGGVWFARAGLGLTAEILGSLFYGAGTQERIATLIPVLSLQAGVWIDYEVLP